MKLNVSSLVIEEKINFCLFKTWTWNWPRKEFHFFVLNWRKLKTFSSFFCLHPFSGRNLGTRNSKFEIVRRQSSLQFSTGNVPQSPVRHHQQPQSYQVFSILFNRFKFIKYFLFIYCHKWVTIYYWYFSNKNHSKFLYTKN